MSGKQEHSSYPDPTAHATSPSGPYRVSDVDSDHQLRAHLEHEIQSDSAAAGSHGSPLGQAQPEAVYQGMPFDYASQVNLGQSPQNANLPMQSATPRQGGFTEVGNEEPARKKTKVTRACDECRRKKIKCDAQPDAPGNPPCSNCQRTKSDCLFSKPAQKRGPSRGYIRDLAERVNALENRGPIPAMGRPMISGAKRSFAEFEASGEAVEAASTSNNGPLSQPLVYASNMTSSHATGPQVNAMDQTVKIELTEDETELLTTWMEEVMHICFPIAVNSIRDCQVLLETCVESIRKGFFLAVHAMLAIETGDPDACFAAYKHLSENLDTSGFPSVTRATQLNSIVMVLYALSYKGHHSIQVPGCSPEHLYGEAIAIISKLRVHLKSSLSLQDTPEARLIYETGRRCLFHLVVLSYWDAAGFAKMRMFDNGDLKGSNPSGDVDLLGPLWNSLAAQAIPLSALLSAMRNSERSTVEYAINIARLEDIVRIVQSHIQDPPFYILAHVSLLSIKILKIRYASNDGKIPIDPEGLDWAKEIIELLTDVNAADFPLSHHFVAITARHCIDSTEVRDLRASAIEALKKLADGLKNGTILKYSAWKYTLGAKIDEKLNSLGGLQNLAHEATRAIGQEPGDEGSIKWSEVLEHGYLNSFI